MTKKIPLTQGKVALVDDADYEQLARHKWYALKVRWCIYAVRHQGEKLVLMHRVILDASADIQIDHRNRNGLDNRRTNLRLASHAENLQNRGPSRSGTSGYKGVSWNKVHYKWQAFIQANGQIRSLGLFTDKNDAALAYNKAALELHGPFAWLNEIESSSGVG